MKHGCLIAVGLIAAMGAWVRPVGAEADAGEPAAPAAYAEAEPAIEMASDRAETGNPQPITPLVADPPAFDPWPRRPVWLMAEVKYLNKYYFRGFVQERDGVIVQPTFKAGIDLFRSNEGPSRRVSAVFGMRSSLHSAKTFAQASPTIWYEADIVAGLNMRLLDRLEAEALYVAIASPNGAFPTVQEFDLNLAFDDRGLWGGDMAIQPRATFAFEFDNSAAGGPRGILMQIGAEPGLTVIHSRELPLRITFPVTAGFSLKNYYILPGGTDDDTFGYVKAGMSLTAPLTFIPPDRGQWAITGGFDVVHLGDNMKAFNRGRSTDVIGRVSLGMRF